MLLLKAATLNIDYETDFGMNELISELCVNPLSDLCQSENEVILERFIN